MSFSPDPALLADRRDPENVYVAFLAAIAARDIDEVIRQSTETFNVCLRRLRHEIDFSVLFDMWCDSYPTSAQFNSCHLDGAQAMLDVELIIGSECIFAAVTLLRFPDGWRVHHEQFYRCRVPAPTITPLLEVDKVTSASKPQLWLDLIRSGRAWPRTHAALR